MGAQDTACLVLRGIVFTALINMDLMFILSTPLLHFVGLRCVKEQKFSGREKKNFVDQPISVFLLVGHGNPYLKLKLISLSVARKLLVLSVGELKCFILKERFDVY